MARYLWHLTAASFGLAIMIIAGTAHISLSFLVARPARQHVDMSIITMPGMANVKPSSGRSNMIGPHFTLPVVRSYGSIISVLAPAAGLLAVALSRSARTLVSRRASRTDWYLKVQRLGNDQALFDVTIPKPLGVKMEKFPAWSKVDGIGISQIVDGGNTDKINEAVCVRDEPGMWVLEGDQVMAIDGEDVEFSDMDEIVDLVTNSEEPDRVTLTLMRNTRRGPVRVVFFEKDGNWKKGMWATVRRGAPLSAAADATGQGSKYGCIDGWCGTCWHRERATNGVFKPCADVLTGDWDNVMPLALRPRPEKVGDATYLKPRGQ